MTGWRGTDTARLCSAQCAAHKAVAASNYLVVGATTKKGVRDGDPVAILVSLGEWEALPQ